MTAVTNYAMDIKSSMVNICITCVNNKTFFISSICKKAIGITQLTISLMLKKKKKKSSKIQTINAIWRNHEYLTGKQLTG